MRRGRWLANAALAAASVLLALLAIEIVLRAGAYLHNRELLHGELFSRGVDMPADGRAELGHLIRLSADADVVYELKPHLQLVYEGAEVVTDARGFRTHGASRSAAEGAPCIVGIGDSFMFGQGVAGSDTYLAVLEERLASRPERRLPVVNTAVPGYNTVMEVAALQAKGLFCAPRVVIVEFVGNDLSLPNFVREPRNPWTLRRSFLHDLMAQRLGLRRDRSLYRGLLDAGLRGIPQEADRELGNTVDPTLVPPQYRGLVGWDAHRRAMTRLRGLADEHGFAAVSISLAPEDSPLEQMALELSRELGFHVLDIGDAFREYQRDNGYESYLESPLALHPDDGHPSALAHRIAGDLLAGFLDQQVLGADRR